MEDRDWYRDWWKKKTALDGSLQAATSPKESSRGRRTIAPRPKTRWYITLVLAAGSFLVAHFASELWTHFKGPAREPRVTDAAPAPKAPPSRPVATAAAAGPVTPTPQAAAPAEPGVLEVQMSRNGYITAGSINGVPVSFMVDTGASHLAIPAELAQRAGVGCGQRAQFSTANGIVTGCTGMAAEISFGPFRLTNVVVNVMPNSPGALLGMDVLRRFQMAWTGDRLRIMGGPNTLAPVQTAQQPAAAGGPPAPVAESLPPTGEVQRNRPSAPGTVYAPLQLVGNQDGQHCVVRLEDWLSGETVVEAFVRGGEVAESRVPLGQYRGSVACGSTWYGAQLFGPSTVSNQFANPLVFARNAAGTIVGMRIQLTQRDSGNLPALPGGLTQQ